MLGIDVGDLDPGFRVFDVETGEFVWEQKSLQWPLWLAVSESKALYGWQLPNSSRLALVNPETNHRDWERSFPAGNLYLGSLENGRAVIGYGGGLTSIEIATGKSIWDTSWDSPGYNMDATAESGVLWAAWQGDDYDLVVSCIDLETGKESWRGTTRLANYNASPSFKSISKDRVVISQNEGIGDILVLALTAWRRSDQSVLWSRDWDNAVCVGETEHAYWLATKKGSIDRIDFVTGETTWSIESPTDDVNMLDGHAPNDGTFLVWSRRHEGVWAYDGFTGDLLWSEKWAWVSSVWGLTDTVLLRYGSGDPAEYRLVDLNTGQRTLRAETANFMLVLDQNRLFLGSESGLEEINGIDGSTIRKSGNLFPLIPRGCAVTNFGDCGAYLGLTVALNDAPDGDALTVFFDKETLRPLAKTQLPKQYVLDTYTSIRKPIFWREGGEELIGVGLGIRG